MAHSKTSVVGTTQADYDSLLQALGLPAEPVREPGCVGNCGDGHSEAFKKIDTMLQDVSLEADDFLTAISRDPEGLLGWIASTAGKAH